MPAEGRRPALACIGGTACTGARECRPRPALACTGARSAGRRPALEHGVPGRRPAVACTGARSAGRTPALGHGVPGRRPALRSPFGHCLQHAYLLKKLLHSSAADHGGWRYEHLNVNVAFSFNSGRSRHSDALDSTLLMLFRRLS